MFRLSSAGPLLVAGLLAFSAEAQTMQSTPGMASAGPAGSTVGGGRPETTGAITSVGQRKPPGTAADGTRPDLDEKSRVLDRKIRTGICSGCN